MQSRSVRRVIGAVVSFMLFAAAAAHAGGAPVSPTYEVPSIVGVVRDSAGRPLGDAQVIISALNRSTVTNDSGRFVLNGLPAGTHHLTALLLGYRPGHADVLVPASDSDVEVVIVMRRATAVQQLSTVQVTATPTGTDPRDVAQSTTEVSGLALARELTSSIAQTLSNEPGISVRFNGPAAAAPVIRGLSGERVLVLNDGQRAGDLSSTSSDHAVSIDPLTAQRIEVVRGPASLLYGNNALGGVVNVISNDLPTTIPSHADGSFSAQGESVTPGGATAAALSVPLSGTLAVIVKGEARRGEDLRMGGGERLSNSHFRNASGAAGLAYANGASNGGLLYRGYGFNYGLPSEDGEAAHIEGNRHELRGRTELGSRFGIFESVRVAGTSQWYTHDEVEETGAIGTRFKLRTQSVDVLGRTRFGAFNGALGVSGLFKQYEATGEEALTPAARSSGAGAFIYQELPLARASDPDAQVPRLQLGARYDLYAIVSRTGDSKFGPGRSLDFNNVSGSIGVSLPLADGVTLGVSAARAFRAPTVEELFSNAFHAAVGTYDVGNPSLVSETNQGIDAFLQTQRSRVTAQLSGYYNRVNNFITPNVVSDTTIDTDAGSSTVPVNRFTQGDATLAGIEGRIEYEVIRNLALGVMGDMVRGQFVRGGALPYMPPARLGTLARYDARTWQFDAEYRHAFAQRRVPTTGADSDPARIATNAYDLVNLSAGYTFDALGRLNSLTLRTDNLFDERYRDATSRIKNFAFNPGRNISLVYRVLF